MFVIDLSQLSQFHGGLPEPNIIEIDMRKSKESKEANKELDKA